MPDFIALLLDLLLTLARWVTWVLGGVALVATLLPVLRQTAWWIRVCDFPRLQIVAGLTLSLVAALALPDTPSLGRDVFAASLAGALVYQIFRIWPYTSLHRKQVADAARPAAADEHHISLLVTNVLMYNRDASRCLGHIRNYQPDIVLAVETDDWWLSQLQGIEKTHPYTCHAPLPNTYGMLVFSRLPLREPQIRYILDPEIPSFHGCAMLPNGVLANLHFLHPKPPAPQESKTSARRDAELLVVGKIIQHHDGPTIVAGDLNDVAWSHTSELFRRLSRLLDPRIGRGLLPDLPRRLQAAALAPGPRVPLGALPHSAAGASYPHRLRPLSHLHPPQLRAQRLAGAGGRTGAGGCRRPRPGPGKN
jgi:endonuclease/exonuclease/phosphatase (EEP) superfamily protein YafD